MYAPKTLVSLDRTTGDRFFAIFLALSDFIPENTDWMNHEFFTNKNSFAVGIDLVSAEVILPPQENQVCKAALVNAHLWKFVADFVPEDNWVEINFRKNLESLRESLQKLIEENGIVTSSLKVYES